MKYRICNGWIEPARHCPSPNHNERPAGEPLSLLVVHNISLPPGQFGGPEIDQLFCNQLDCSKHPYFERLQGLEVSSHLLIRRCGELVQYVPFDRRAWHAGQSSYGGRENCNDFSVGIEMEGTDDTPFEATQYQVLVDVTRTLLQHYPAMSGDRITGHSDIAPGRKTDPGPCFDWGRFYALLGVTD